MELYEAIRTRHSVRVYEDKPVPEVKLLKILEAARLAPSASNRQPCKFIVVADSERRHALARAAGQTHIAAAPVVIAAVATMPDYVMRSGIPTHPIDLAIAVDHMTLAAVNEGLGTCWIGGFPQDHVKTILKVPDSCRVIVLMTLGYPKQTRFEKTRKPLTDLVCYEEYSG